MPATEVTNAGRADLVPGFIFSKPGVNEIGQAEAAFTSRYVETMAKGVAGLPRDIILEIMRDCARDVIVQTLAYGGTGFDIWARTRSSLPLLAYLSASIKHGDKVTMDLVAAWLESPDSQRIADGVWELWGYPPVPPKNGGGENADQESPSTGKESSASSPAPPPTDTASPPSNSAA